MFRAIAFRKSSERGSVTSRHIRSFLEPEVVGWSLMPFGAAHQGSAVVRLANMDAKKAMKSLRKLRSRGVAREDFPSRWVSRVRFGRGRIRLAFGWMWAILIVMGRQVGRGRWARGRKFVFFKQMNTKPDFWRTISFRGGVNVALGNVDTDATLEFL